MNTSRALVVVVVIALSACGGADDVRACVLLEDVPDQVEEATLEGVTAVAQAAQESEVSELKALGERLAQNLTRSQALERLAPGSFLEVVQADLDDLRRACGVQPVDTSSDEIGDNEDERDDERDEEAQRDANTRERDERRSLDFARLELLA